MTIEAWDGPISYVVAGSGPYPVEWPYGTGSVQLFIRTSAGTEDAVDGTEWNIAPLSSDHRGNVTLSASLAARFAGQELLIRRRSIREQGWQGILGEREKGLERQLDELVKSVQEIDYDVDHARSSIKAAIDASIAASEAADIATRAAMLSTNYWFADFATMMLSRLLLPVGLVVATRTEGWAYEVVGPPLSPHLTTAGGVMLRVAKQPRVTLRAYGAIGDVVADDAGVIATAVADARTRGMVLDGEGLTYRIGSALTVTPGTVENMTIDASGITAAIAWDIVGPAFETARPLAANVGQGTRQISVTTAGYALGDVIVLLSDLLLETATNSLCGHWGEVVSVASGALSLSHATECNLMLADNARAQRMPKVAGVALRRVRVIGSASCPGGIQMTRLYKPVVEDCEAVNTEVRGFSLVNCFMPRTHNLRGEKCDRTGLGYALNVSGCGFAEIGDTYGRRCRHVIAWGAANTIPCTGGSFGSVIGAECVGSVFDTHPGAIAIWQRGGMVIGDMAVTAAGQDAITMQAAGGSCRARITGTGHRHVCLVQTFHNAAAFDAFPSVVAEIEGDTSGGQLLAVAVDGSMGLRTVAIKVIGSASAEAASVKVADGTALGHVSLHGNCTSGARAILVNQQAQGRIGNLSLAGRWRTTNAAQMAAQVIGPTDAAAPRTNINVAGLDASGGTYGLRVDNRADAKGASVAFLSGSTAATITSGGATIS